MERLSLARPLITWMEGIGDSFTFFVGYGYATPTLDFGKIEVPRLEIPILPREELVSLVKGKLGRPIVVVGGTTGSDAHTVGIDAILSIKGIHGDRGLEHYPCFKVINLRAQVSNQVLVEKAAEAKADAILVSKLVTQQDQHLEDLRQLVDLLRKEEGLARHLLRIVGGPRMDHRIARQIGFDAGFGVGTRPSEVANYIIQELIKRVEHAKGKGGMEDGPDSSSQKKRRPLLGWLGGGGEDP